MLEKMDHPSPMCLTMEEGESFVLSVEEKVPKSPKSCWECLDLSFVSYLLLFTIEQC